jgi:hypothetical protein
MVQEMQIFMLRHVGLFSLRLTGYGSVGGVEGTTYKFMSTYIVGGKCIVYNK